MSGLKYVAKTLPFLIIPVLGADAFAQTPGKTEIEIIEQYFYVEIADKNGNVLRERTMRVPNLPNRACFGWVIEFKPQKALVKITEIFTLPAPPKQWTGVEDNPYTQTKTSNNRKTATTNTFKALNAGKMENAWCVEKGDANGDHQIIVLHEDRVLAEFRFELHN